MIKTVTSLFLDMGMRSAFRHLGDSIIVTVFKKGARGVRSGHREVSLISIATGVLASIMIHRFAFVRTASGSRTAAGFFSGRVWVDQTFDPCQLLEMRHTLSPHSHDCSRFGKGDLPSRPNCSIQCFYWKSMSQ